MVMWPFESRAYADSHAKKGGGEPSAVAATAERNERLGSARDLAIMEVAAAMWESSFAKPPSSPPSNLP